MKRNHLGLYPFWLMLMTYTPGLAQMTRPLEVEADSVGKIIRDETVTDHLATTTDRIVTGAGMLPGYRGIDAMDGDRALYLQNGLERAVDLALDFPDSVIAVGIGGTFTDSILEVRAIDSGHGWESTRYVNSIFLRYYDNMAGTFQVSTAIIGSPIGLTAAGPHIMASLIVRSKDNALSSTRRFMDGTIAQANSQLVDIHGDQPDVTFWTTRNVNLRWRPVRKCDRMRPSPYAASR
jgi:hypothetical protein